MAGSGLSETKTVLGPGNFIQLGTLVTVLAATVGGTLWLSRTDNRLSNLERDLAGLSLRSDSNVSRDLFELWAELLAAKNPQITVPRLPPARR